MFMPAFSLDGLHRIAVNSGVDDGWLRKIRLAEFAKLTCFGIQGGSRHGG
jgi:hypothetical protein